MNEQAKDAWISLNVGYRIDPDATPCDLLDDATLWLDGARGMAQTLSHAMRYVDNINTDHLASALFGVATLVDMGCGCAELAHVRMRTEPRKRKG